jgi:hypothetical protein
MKKYFIIICISLLPLTAKALNFTIVNGSFDETISVAQGSEQYVDVTISGSYTSSSTLRVFISHENGTSSGSNLLELLNEQFSTYYFSLPENPDGSRRITFNLPTNYITGTFFITVNLTTSKRFGILDDMPTAILSKTEALNKYNTSFYTLTGIKTIFLSEGFYIMITGSRKEIVYIKD